MMKASITCPICEITSYHPDDVRVGYCGNCHDFTGPKHAEHYHGHRQMFSPRAWTSGPEGRDR